MLIDMNRRLHGSAGTPEAMTHRGMAHFAGTGPAGKTCGQCEHWDTAEKARTRVCLQARRLGSKCATAIPPEALACKYFEQAAPRS